jgi:hypothetical protein
MTGRRIAQILTAAGCFSYALLVIDMARQSPSPVFITLVIAFGLVSTIATALFAHFRIERDLAYGRGLHSVTKTLRN